MVLVVEDEAAIRLLLQRALAPGGFRVVTAADGGAAMDLIESGVWPDVALVDLMMPGMDGRGFLEASRERGHTFPSLILSGAVEGQTVARELRCAGHIEKPYDVDELLERVTALVERRAA